MSKICDYVSPGCHVEDSKEECPYWDGASDCPVFDGPEVEREIEIEIEVKENDSKKN